MPLIFERNDIVRMNVDAIVIPANEELLQGSGTSRAIFKAAGEDALAKACELIGHCDMGRAVITGGFNLPAKHIIHAVCPMWFDGESNEKELLYSVYTKSLELARSHKVKSIAFPLLSSGNYGYPKDRALSVASHAITDFLLRHEMDVYLVFYSDDALKEGRKLSPVTENIDSSYVKENDEEYWEDYRSFTRRMRGRRKDPEGAKAWQMSIDLSDLPVDRNDEKRKVSQENLDVLLKTVDDPFSVKMKRFVEQERKAGRQVKDIYTCANVKKKQFYKLMENPYVTPKKTTVLGIAVGLRLSLRHTKELLDSAGYTLSKSSGADIIVEHYIRNRQYSCPQINLALYENGFEDFQIGSMPKKKTAR